MDDLVLLHAFPLDVRMWDVPGAVTPTLHGHGEPDLTTLAEDVLAELDARGLRQVILGGCSMGGYVAMALLRIAPERVKGLVFVDTKHTADAPEAVATRHAMAERVEREGIDEWLPDALLPNLLGPTGVRRRQEPGAHHDPGAAARGRGVVAAGDGEAAGLDGDAGVDGRAVAGAGG